MINSIGTSLTATEDITEDITGYYTYYRSRVCTRLTDTIDNACHVATAIYATIYLSVLSNLCASEALHLTHVWEVGQTCGVVSTATIQRSTLYTCTTTEYVTIYTTRTATLIRLGERDIDVGIATYLTEVVTSLIISNDVTRDASSDIGTTSKFLPLTEVTVSTAIYTVYEGRTTEFHIRIFLYQTGIATTDNTQYGVATDTVVIAIDTHAGIICHCCDLLVISKWHVK